MKEIILYGADNIGMKHFDFLKRQGIDSLVYAFCDKIADGQAEEKRRGKKF